MSSLRNTVQRRNHRERAQPLERSKWGILEKPKDYKLRAADHKVKKRKLKALQQKASERNEDEFYFGMMSSQSQGGVKVAKRGSENAGGSKLLGEEVVKLMKTQDVGYLRTVLQQTRRERERVGREVVGGEVGVETELPRPDGKRVVFGEDDEGVEQEPLRNQKQEIVDLQSWSSDEESAEDDTADGKTLSVEERRKRKKQEARRRKLQALKDREEDLSVALQEVEQQRAKMNGSVGGVNKNGVKFKVRERKR
ncbi:hypothetical protein LTR37_013480 [Vermiconidia calcicola]|uniref:Uncharacterized protein n=1 Tax=Vermiconidia calcicola TaxID=1690605 RepID=A0ACC3MWF4_9PEZI|nr:hypothetical protein LTR37_013480 [Vermiconidia calcicola]